MSAMSGKPGGSLPRVGAVTRPGGGDGGDGSPGVSTEHRAHGAWITTVDDRRLLNCGGYGVLTLGAAHQTVVRRVGEQLERLPFGSKTLPHDRAAAAADALRSVLPEPLTEVAFATTGAEAVEMALRLVRLNRCSRLITTSGGFHGRTLGALSVNGVERLRRLHRPLLGGVDIVPFADEAALEHALAQSTERTAVLVEPVQGEAGVQVPPAGYLTAVAEACQRHRALLIADEVQTGLGRLGYRWGVERSDVVPDILVAGKALGGGVLPVSAIAARQAVFTPFRRDPRQASATFSGFPLAAAAVTATTEVLEREDVVGRARQVGSSVWQTLSEAAGLAGNRVREVRGLGLLHGIEFAHPRDASRFGDALIDHGVVPSYSLATTATVRLTPPALLEGPELGHLREAVIAATGDMLAASG